MQNITISINLDTDKTNIDLSKFGYTLSLDKGDVITVPDKKAITNTKPVPE